MEAPKVVYVASVNRNNAIGSYLIKETTKSLESPIKPCSHLCIILRKTLVIESTVCSGVRIIPYTHWLKKNKIIYVFEKEYEGKLSQYIPKLMDRLWGVPYDILGILYFTWRIILWLLFKIPLPKINKWQSQYKRFCVEIFGEKLGMVSPIQMVAEWKKDEQLIELDVQEFEGKN